MLVSVVLAATTMVACDATPVMVSGHVTASPADSNLVGVPISVYANDSETQVASGTTNPFGVFEIRESTLPAGTYRLRIGGQWWPTGATWADATPVVMTSGAPAVADLALPQQATLFGTVVDGGAPAAGVNVAAIDGNGTAVGTVVTDDNGHFRIGVLAAGTYTVVLNRGGTEIVVDVGGAVATEFSPGLGDDLDVGTIELATGLPDTTARLSLGVYYSCALRTDHSVSCWGSNGRGELGNGTTTPSDVPVTVSGVGDATEVAAKHLHTCAVRIGGTVACWGNNSSGQLGHGDYTTSSLPVAVVGVSDASAVAVGSAYSCALRSGGTVACWGDNTYGVLGNGTNTSSNVPVSVSGISDATAIAGGEYHVCVRRAGGTVACWGLNRNGQLGNGAVVDSNVPVAVTGISDAVALASGVEHTCALRTGGTLECWGLNQYLQLGHTTADSYSDVPVEAGGISDATAVAAGYIHTCAVRAGGTVACWGNNGYGQLGDGTYNQAFLAPVAVTGIDDATAIAAGSYHSCVLRADDTVACWGYNGDGELGNGTTDNSNVPVDVIGF